MLNSAADELEMWEPEEEEPTEDDEYDEETDFQEAHEAWLGAARESLQAAIDGMELP
jgi:hypothetical protein